MPLFETVNDLKNASEVMEKLYTHPFYKSHLKETRQQANHYAGL
jgi:phosphoenolpyruvate carboxylase